MAKRLLDGLRSMAREKKEMRRSSLGHFSNTMRPNLGLRRADIAVPIQHIRRSELATPSRTSRIESSCKHRQPDSAN